MGKGKFTPLPVILMGLITRILDHLMGAQLSSTYILMGKGKLLPFVFLMGD